MQYAQVRDTLRGYWPGGQLIEPNVLGLSLSEAYHGARRVIERDGRRLLVNIPPGVHTGAKVYVTRTSQSNARRAEYCTIVVHDQPPFKRYGDNLHLEFSIDAFVAILGGTVQVPTIDGQAALQVPPGTAPGTTLRLPGQGMPIFGGPDQHGDLCVHLHVTVPEQATPLERKLIDDTAWLHGWHFHHH